MSKNARSPDAARLRELDRRQGVPKWRADYEAGIRAVREEAPRDSRPSTLYSAACNRKLHALSIVEREVDLITEYNQRVVVEKLDQWVIPTSPQDHVLTHAPFYSGPKLPRYRGSINVARELGCLKFHPVVVADGVLVPFPFIGDLLLFLMDPPHVWTVNLTIKAAPEDFERPFRGKRRPKDPERAAAKERARHAVEEMLHLDVGTRTVRVTQQDYSPILAKNLEWLHLWRIERLHISESNQCRVAEAFATGLEQEKTPMQVLRALRSRYDIDEDQIRIVLCRQIFERRLLVDLLGQRILMDQPMRPEEENPLDKLAHWFSRN